MELDKYEVDLVQGLLDKVNKEGVISKSDILSLEGSKEGVISSFMSVNKFTSLKSSTGLKELKVGLESLLDRGPKPTKITIDVLVSSVRSLKNEIKKIKSDLPNTEVNMELVSDIISNHFLLEHVKTEDGRDANDLIDTDISLIATKLDIIVDRLSKDITNSNILKSISVIKHDLSKELYGNPKEAFSLLRINLKNNLTIEMVDSDICEPTIRDLIKTYVVNNRLRISLDALESNIDLFLEELVFDETYDENINSSVAFEYDRINKSVENLRFLLRDTVSIKLIILFKLLLFK